jgi:hypothetical protein
VKAPNLDELISALAQAIPELPGARCRGRHELFDLAPPWEDDDTRRYRTDAAKRLCGACPALIACGTWFDGLEPSDRPSGVIAGRLYNPRRAKSEIEAERKEMEEEMNTATTKGTNP